MALVVCSENHVDLRVSEGSGLSDNIETEPVPKSQETGEVSHVPALVDIVDTDFMGPSLVFGDVSDPPVSVGRLFPVRAHPSRCSGIHWDCRTSLRTLIREYVG